MAGPIEIEHHDKCSECGAHMELEVLRSAAGYYLGTECEVHGPYGRESEYFSSRKEAEDALVQWQAGNKVKARTTGFKGTGGSNLELWLVDEHFEDFAKNQPDQPEGR